MAFRIILINLVFFLSSCDQGLSPEMADIKVGFSGEITFIGEWYKEVTQTHVVLFKDPLLSKEDFNVFNLKYVSDSIANGSEFYKYSTDQNSLIENIEAGDYAYLAVAQSKREVLSLNREDWKVVGVYYTEGDTTKPGTLTIPEKSFVDSVNIVCDFNNPPPQPPGGVNFQNILNSVIHTSSISDLKSENN